MIGPICNGATGPTGPNGPSGFNGPSGSSRILESSDQNLTSTVAVDLGPYTLNAGEVPLALVYVTNAEEGESYGEGSSAGTFTGAWWQRSNGVANQFTLRLYQTSGGDRTYRIRLWAIKP